VCVPTRAHQPTTDPKDTMRTSTRLLMAALTTVLVVALGASIATALRSIRINGAAQGEEIFASSRLTFGPREGGGALPANSQVICDVTLLRTISTLIPKRVGVLFGRVTGIRIDRRSCRSNLGPVEAVVPLISERTPGTHSESGNNILLYDLRGAPAENWKLIYDSPQGILPEIEGINFHITAVRFRLTISGVSCLWGRGESAFGLIAIRRETSVITGARAVLERTSLARVEGGFLCPAQGPGSFSGEFAITLPRGGSLEIDLL
jgi:hypothetical protein